MPTPYFTSRFHWCSTYYKANEEEEIIEIIAQERKISNLNRKRKPHEENKPQHYGVKGNRLMKFVCNKTNMLINELK